MVDLIWLTIALPLAGVVLLLLFGKRLGVVGKIRTVDPAQYQNRVRDFDYDVIISTFGQSR